jgi:hypothetical protein
MRTAPALALLAALIACASCTDDAPPQDAGPGEDVGVPDADDDLVDPGPGCLTAIPVDLLFVVDNSVSMEQEQENLAQNFQHMIEVLTSPSDLDGDGDDDAPPVDDLRVGVVSSDMGAGSDAVLGCTAAGDGGALIAASRSDAAGCAGLQLGPPPWISLGPAAGITAEQVASQFACLARLGTGGCGYEQHLASATAALTSMAGAGGPNEGFIREGSLVAIVILADEDDCSTSDSSLFDPNPAAMEELGPTGTRCALNPDRVDPIASFVTALDPLRLDRAPGMVVAVIAGVPSDLVADPEAIDYDALLADERMQARPDPDDPSQLAPACSATSVGSAAPARRLVEFVRDFAPGERGLVQSICTSDLRPAMQAIAHLVTRRLCDRPY